MNEPSADPGRGDFSNADRATAIGFVVTAAGGVFGAIFRATDPPGHASVAAMAIIVVGLIVTGIGIARKPRSIFGLLLGAGASALAWLGCHVAWDSFHLLSGVMTAVALVAAMVLLLPRTGRRLVVSGLIAFHFCGVIASITSPAPQSWISLWSWTTLFRPHLVFCYTNNAYQFYSPEPGPANLLWFCIEGHDGQKAWFKLPRKPETRLDPLGVEYFRRLSITESANQNYSLAVIPQQALDRRYQAVQQIPMHPEIPQQSQYRLPQDNVRRWIASYVRHVAQMYGGTDKVKSIRLYRVLHQPLDVAMFRAGEDPFSKWTYLPYFLGEYDVDGNLSDPYDPTLFWLIPIVRKTPSLAGIARQKGSPVEVDNYLARHAGSDPFEEDTDARSK
jgi:hypothetical protein